MLSLILRLIHCTTHSAFSTPIELMQFIGLFKAMLKTGIKPDLLRLMAEKVVLGLHHYNTIIQYGCRLEMRLYL
ncbi:MAG: hypothetical protein ACJASG_001146 [Oleiphilaceae bacterium]|jgi:hypothetical protein